MGSPRGPRGLAPWKGSREPLPTDPPDTSGRALWEGASITVAGTVRGPGRLPHTARVGLTFVLVLFSWVLFRSASFHEAASYLGAMFGLGGTADPSALLLPGQLYTREAFAVMTACAVLVFGYSPRRFI